MISDLTHWFTGFLRRRRTLKHYGRHPLVDTLAGHGPTEAAPEPLARDLLLVARDEPAAAIACLKSHEDGLSACEAAGSLARSGPGILLGYCVLTTVMKRFYIRRFGWQ